MATATETTDPSRTTVDPTAIATACFEHLEAAWNAADGPASGQVFADDTDFVNIRGEHFRGDGAMIGQAHQMIFDTIYLGSTMHYDIDVAREIVPGCIVAVVTSTLDAPIGPLQGVNQSKITAVFTKEGDRWSIMAFQNTLVSAVV